MSFHDLIDNVILNTDSYKASHYLQYPPGTQYMFSYVEARGGPLPYTIFFGLQAILQQHFTKPITAESINAAEDLLTRHGLPFNRAGWERILTVHGGYLPIRVRALPEGSKVPLHTPLFTVINTDEQLPWLTSYVETALLRAWYPTTVATISYSVKALILDALKATSDDPFNEINFKLHDFGSRGVSSFDSAGLGGMAHLVNFMGTDTLTALIYANEFYDEPMAGFSIPASEHSTITSWGRENEVDAFSNMIDQFAGPNKLYACVSDSFNIFEAVSTLWGEKLKDKVLTSGGMLVVRPDSGRPVDIVRETLLRLDATFGSTVNAKGYKVLNGVRVIQGDGVNPDSIKEILDMMLTEGFSITNIAFGMGGALLQKLDRDTFKFAYKASATCISGDWHDVYKDPITDPGKRSKKGLLDVTVIDGEFATVLYQYLGGSNAGGQFAPCNDSAMRTVFDNGILRRMPFSEVRANANLELVNANLELVNV